VAIRYPRRRDFLISGGALLAGCSAATKPHAAAAPTPARSTSAAAGAPPSARPSPGPGLNGGGDIVHGARTGDRVALTFHGAGSDALTRAVLAALAAARAHVTVFAVGSWLEGDPSVAGRILDAGHELGNHTYHHLPMRTLSSADAQAEVARAAAVLVRLTGSRGAWFRPSGTPMSTPDIRVAARRSGYPVCVSYDVDSLDWTDPGARAVVTTVLTRVRPGSIVSLHLGHPGTASALPGLLVGLAQRGLRPVTVSELLR
jgi:peptidoglycan/xylan/chitin deacetylase (PgdA/CDA1 family)